MPRPAETPPPPNTPKCPQCNHAVTANRVVCPGCKKEYHELCLKRGCIRGVDCGQAEVSASAGSSKADKGFLLTPFLATFSGLLTGYERFDQLLTASPWFTPAVGSGLVGMLLGAAVGPSEKRAFAGRIAAFFLLLASLVAGSVAGAGREVPGIPIAMALAAAGAAFAIIGLVIDGRRGPALTCLVLTAHLFAVTATVLKPSFAGVMWQRARAGNWMGGRGAAPPMGLRPNQPALTVNGVLSVGGRRQALTDRGSFGVGQQIPGVGAVTQITDDQVTIRSDEGHVDTFQVPH